MLHLDLKPSNIIATHGMAKVLDLSVARPPGPHRGGIGTTGYMAPEQSLGGELGPYTDVWGIGAMLYEVATGEPACDVGDETSTTEARPYPAVLSQSAARDAAACSGLRDRSLSELRSRRSANRG